MSLANNKLFKTVSSWINRFVPVIEKGFGETWMFEQDMVTSFSVFPLLLLTCEVLWEGQISSTSISDFPWQDRDLLLDWIIGELIYRKLLSDLKLFIWPLPRSVSASSLAALLYRALTDAMSNNQSMESQIFAPGSLLFSDKYLNKRNAFNKVFSVRPSEKSVFFLQLLTIKLLNLTHIS